MTSVENEEEEEAEVENKSSLELRGETLLG